MRVLVTGGTGRLAREIFRRPTAEAFRWRVLSRRPAPAGGRDWAVGDLASGAGLGEALTGIDTVLHLASDATRPDDDVVGAEHLVRAAAAAGTTHLVYLSIIGIDRIPLPYYRAKLGAEQVIAAGPVPWTILRAAQFHSFIDWLLGRAASVPLVLPVPAGFRVQSVADVEMADRLLAVLHGPPSGRLRDFAGPEMLTVREAAKAWRDVRGLRRPIIPIPVPGAVGAGFRTGANTAADAERGTMTWRTWLEARYRPNERR